MSHQNYLVINGQNLPLPTVYSIGYRDIEADSGGETEAGTIQRDVLRLGVVTIQVSFNCSPTWVKRLSVLTQVPMLQVKYLDTRDLQFKTTTMYLDNFSVQLIKVTSYQGLWEVSFSLHEY